MFMKQAAMLFALFAMLAFSSAQAGDCNWMKKSTKINYANKVEKTERQVADKAPVVDLEEGKEVATVVTPATGTN
jgi:hypothetical protein